MFKYRLVILLSVCILAPLLLSACIRPHKAPVTQGNLVNEKDMQRIEIGMTKEQVDFLIGRPILIDPFNKSVWEYVYLAYYGYQKPIKRKMTFTFDGDVLAKKEGSLLPEKNSNTNEFGDSAEPIEIKEASD